MMCSAKTAMTCANIDVGSRNMQKASCMKWASRPSGAVEPDCAGEKSLLDLRLPAKEPVTLERISGEEPNAEPARGCESALSGDALSSAGMGKMPKNEYDA
ncbi:MAG: hypothetical protein DUD39_02655 [Coriobacteriaceae bacterium]|nr:MAG: hypothetical protein DUD39_02655 [Coriobacteriaceae bacterium]